MGVSVVEHKYNGQTIYCNATVHTISFDSTSRQKKSLQIIVLGKTEFSLSLYATHKLMLIIQYIKDKHTFGIVTLYFRDMLSYEPSVTLIQ